MVKKPKLLPVSDMDVLHLRQLRDNVTAFMRRTGKSYAGQPGRLLDIAPQVHAGARPFFPAHVEIETFDIDPQSGCTHIGDICQRNRVLKSGAYQYVVCTEVLEHTLQPFAAVAEIERILAPNGLLFLTVPFNFRIHGPLPDCWRFSEHGLRAILNRFEVIELKALETPGRNLMPIHYTVVARKPAGGGPGNSAQRKPYK